MRVVFMGTPSFAVPSLLALTAVHEVVGVYTRPDAASGRGSALRPSPVKEAATKLCIPVREPRSLRDSNQAAELRDLAPDIVVVAAYGLILPASILDVPEFGCVNVHASLLPRWRGAAPVQRAILEGDAETGVSIMRMETGLDTGAYCLQIPVAIGSLSADELTAALAEAGAGAVLSALDAIASGEAQWTEQDEAAVTYADKISKADVLPTPDSPAERIERQVRASSRQAPARVRIADSLVTLMNATALGADAPSLAPSEALAEPRGVWLGTTRGAVLVSAVKPEGRSAMPAADWARGARVERTTWCAA